MEPPEHARAAAPGAAGDPMVGRLLDGRYRIGARVAGRSAAEPVRERQAERARAAAEPR